MPKNTQDLLKQLIRELNADELDDASERLWEAANEARQRGGAIVTPVDSSAPARDHPVSPLPQQRVTLELPLVFRWAAWSLVVMVLIQAVMFLFRLLVSFRVF